MADTATLDRARQALEDHAWDDAYETFRRLDSETRLTGEDLERLAEASRWTLHAQDCIDALERAYAAYLAEGNERRAAYIAIHLIDEYHNRARPAIANGWQQRATRLLDALPEGIEHAWLETALARNDLESGAIAEAERRAEHVLDLGTRFRDRDLQAFALMQQGMAAIRDARVDEGFSKVDEATVAAVAGELTPLSTGILYCLAIEACRDVADYNRARDWTEAAARWCARQSVPGFPGVCRVHRAEIMRLRGAMADAEAEARRSITELEAFGVLPMVGAGFYEIGVVRMRMGDLAGADEAFGQAHALGWDPQPGLSLLQLARRQLDAAQDGIAASLAEPQQRLARARLLPAQVEIALAAHDVAVAREAAEELADIASAFGAPLLHAAAHQALGRILTHEGDTGRAVAELRSAVRHWHDADFPYETAEARRWLAFALLSGGNDAAAALELRAARAAFERLGAELDVGRCDEMLRAAEGRPSRRVARTFMFTDIVGSTNLLEALGDKAWEDVTRWHAETLKGLIRAHQGEVVHPTGDGVFATFADPADAVACAVAIQRRLADHRRQAGFAPEVRIGLHAGEATAIADDYAGIAVHEAARVAALADGGEILATVETLSSASTDVAVLDEREVALKGLSAPVRVVAVAWRAP